MYGEKGVIQSLSNGNKIIKHKIPTSPGQSGSPLLHISAENGPQIVALHIKASATVAVALMLTPTIINRINSWIEEMKLVIDLNDKDIGLEGVKVFMKQV